MDVNKVWVVYFSATGNTDKTANTIGDALARNLDIPWNGFPLPGRQNV